MPFICSLLIQTVQNEIKFYIIYWFTAVNTYSFLFFERLFRVNHFGVGHLTAAIAILANNSLH